MKLEIMIYINVSWLCVNWEECLRPANSSREEDSPAGGAKILTHQSGAINPGSFRFCRFSSNTHCATSSSFTAVCFNTIGISNGVMRKTPQIRTENFSPATAPN
jgi:hypothetical protein